MGLADQLTVARAVAVPFVIVLFAWPFEHHAYWATALFCVAMATDFFDGRIARRHGRTSALGSLLDPVADKVLVLAVLVMLIGERVVPAWMVAGDMLFKPLGSSRLQRVQGAYVSEEEIALVVEQCRGQREQELDESLLELPEVFASESEGDEHGEFDPDDDPLLDKAIEIVVQTQTASVSLLQRRLRVGYTRAGRLVDMLERRGIISGYEGSKPRRVLVDENQLERVSG